jgi:putative component of toxin-antitoxin plasmid stabilization module
MPNFVLHQIEEITGRIKIFKLGVDGIVAYNAFETEIKKDGTFDKELNNVQAILEQYAQNKSLPPTKFKELRGCRDAYTEYEIKTRNLRVYLFKEEKTGSIILWGGKKNTQIKDISTFRKIKGAYIENKKLK